MLSEAGVGERPWIRECAIGWADELRKLIDRNYGGDGGLNNTVYNVLSGVPIGKKSLGPWHKRRSLVGKICLTLVLFMLNHVSTAINDFLSGELRLLFSLLLLFLRSGRHVATATGWSSGHVRKLPSVESNVLFEWSGHWIQKHIMFHRLHVSYTRNGVHRLLVTHRIQAGVSFDEVCKTGLCSGAWVRHLHADERNGRGIWDKVIYCCNDDVYIHGGSGTAEISDKKHLVYRIKRGNSGVINVRLFRNAPCVKGRTDGTSLKERAYRHLS